MTSRSRRAGFTLIEMMVSMALTLVIMTIMTQAFIMALDTFSGLKGIGDMQQNLRTAAVLLRSDLGSDHFEGKRRLSDANLVRPGNGPQAGFFAVKQGSAVSNTVGAPYFNEGADLNLLPSFRASDHFLYFTAKRRGNRQENFFSTTVASDPGTLGTFFGQQTAYNIPSKFFPEVTLTPAYNPSTDLQGTYASQWAEVLYYLQQTGTTEEPTNLSSTLGNPIYSLYRAQFVMPPDSTALNTTANIPSTQSSAFAGLSCNPNGNVLTFYSPVDAASGKRTIDPSNPQGARILASSTLVLPNVLSFQVQLMPVGSVNFKDIPGNLLYDTTKFNSAGANTFGLKAIQVTMRIWDVKTRQTRQMSVLQEL